jgi:hypothetical protein
MDLDLLGSLGWREGLIAIIVLLVVLHRRPLSAHAAPAARGVAALWPLAAQAAVAAYSAVQEPASVAAWRSRSSRAVGSPVQRSVRRPWLAGTCRSAAAGIRLERAAAEIPGQA